MLGMPRHKDDGGVEYRLRVPDESVGFGVFETAAATTQRCNGGIVRGVSRMASELQAHVERDRVRILWVNVHATRVNRLTPELTDAGGQGRWN
jgi:hypothetical protein